MIQPDAGHHGGASPAYGAWLQGVLIALALASVMATIVVACLRITYPFELEWLEGGLLDHVIWIRNGNSLYCPPTFDHIPYLYNPLFFYLTAGVMEFTGEGFFAVRLVPLVSTCVSYMLIFVIVRRHTSSAGLGMIATGLYAASYGWCGSLFDIGRIDPLVTVCLLGAVYCATRTPRLRWFVVSSVLMFLALYTKQSALATIVGILVGMIFVDRRAGIIASMVFGLLTGIAVGIESFASDGWYLFYVYDIPKSAGIRDNVFGYFVMYEFWIVAPMALLLVAALGSSLKQRTGRDIPIYSAVFTTLIGCIASSAHPAASMNTWVLGAAFLAVVTCLHRPGIVRYVLILTQFGLFATLHPFAFLPTQQDLDAGRRVLERIEAIEGPVFIPFHGGLGAMAGKRRWAHLQALIDIVESSRKAQKLDVLEPLAASYLARFKGINPPTVIMIDMEAENLSTFDFLAGYRITGRFEYEGPSDLRSVGMGRRGAPRPGVVLTRDH